MKEYHPPTKVSLDIIKHAIRHIPNKQILLDKIHPRTQNPLMGLRPHVYNDSGRLQSVY